MCGLPLTSLLFLQHERAAEAKEEHLAHGSWLSPHRGAVQPHFFRLHAVPAPWIHAPPGEGRKGDGKPPQG